MSEELLRLAEDVAAMHVGNGYTYCHCDMRADAGRFTGHYHNCPARLVKEAKRLVATHIRVRHMEPIGVAIRTDEPKAVALQVLTPEEGP